MESISLVRGPIPVVTHLFDHGGVAADTLQPPPEDTNQSTDRDGQKTTHTDRQQIVKRERNTQTTIHIHI